ncbi:MAG: transcription-repair coupling factor [Chitinispirillaceae bacterium]|nr:transcription-repair coupling factor [Chitinispirillaceae bacterium]
MASEVTLATLLHSYSPYTLEVFLRDNPLVSYFKGLAGSSDSFLISSIFRKLQRTVVIFTENSKKAEIITNECKSLIGEEEVLYYPSRDAIPYNLKSPFGPTVEGRLNVLTQLIDGKKRIIVAPVNSLLQKVPLPKELFNRTIRLHCNDEISIDCLSQWLTESGFHRENSVTDIGMFSIRGGIVDIYPFLTENPIRIEFWGNTIESIRYFDVFSQKSIEYVNSVTIVPLREFLFSNFQLDNAISKIEKFASVNQSIANGAEKILHQWKSGDYEGIEWFFHWFDFEVTSFLDYLPSDAIVIWDDIAPLLKRFEEVKENYMRHLNSTPPLFQPLLSLPEQLLFSYEEIEEFLSCFQRIYFDTVTSDVEVKTYSFTFGEQPYFTRDIESIVDGLKGYILNGYRCIFTVQSEGQAERLSELLGEDSLLLEFFVGYLSKGFIDHNSKIIVYTDNRGSSPQVKVRSTKKRSYVASLPTFDALLPNDYVVHEEHGIAKFLGIEKISAGDIKQDCMVLLYAEGTKIYVPVYDFHKVQKYIGKDSSPPTLSKIGTSAWEKIKKKTKEALQETAKELIELYAKRQFLEGIKFNPDTIWQKEFEDSFIYEETPDQLRAIKEVKEDMESSKPMDRLICGDVGFGKTEVAMRAAFKAVMSGYQVAVMAPTTILAAQHFATFSERMANFPIRIVMMSRFVRSSEQKENLQKIKNGEADIIIGTHRLLSDDIVFKNLGLLIIDEEQRFGVKHKEKIKSLKYKIDVLSLTATPIPRTLQLSLIGARDLSIIVTPPKNRLPVKTTVAPYHEELIKNAIENELERGGQIYFVNNLIKPLEHIRDTLERLVPKAKVVIAHGDMDEELLARVMKEFIAGRYDILLSTTIIENGLDIPNVNTIIVNRADKLGLSQLYQLRGRVGRSSEQAFAYFLTPPFNEVGDTALRRLKALEQYTELGSGFQIAMRDLEIRGAGNILGTKQHGFIEAVGFEMYCRILKEAMDEIKGVPLEPKKPETKIEIPIDAYLPNEYVPDGATRVSIYQELSSVTDYEAISEIENSLLDRFGPFPQPVVSLFLSLRIKVLASDIGIVKLTLSKKGILSMVIEGEEVKVRKIIELFLKNTRYNFKIENSIPLIIETSLYSAEILSQCNEIIEMLLEVRKSNS